jgi:UDP-galactopyranose mutase
MARVVVIGGGIGGTATAARLAKLKHQVTLVEQHHRLGGALGLLEQDGFTWDTGPASTALPAALRDLFRKSGRTLDREVDLVPLTPMREHRFTDGAALPLPSGSRAEQLDAVDAALGRGAGLAWVDYVHSFADAWDVLRRHYLERPFSPEHADRATLALLRTRTSLHKVVTQRFRKDERLQRLATFHALMGGHDPRNVPAWGGFVDYVEQNFGTWTVPGGMGRLAEVMTKRLRERRVEVLLGTSTSDIVLRGGRAVGVETSAGSIDADLVVCAIDPRRIPVLAQHVRRTMPALPPVVSHLGLVGDVPQLPAEVVLHGDPTLVVRTTGGVGASPDSAGAHPAGSGATGDGTDRAAWTVLGRGKLSEDVVTALARRKIDVRSMVVTRIDRSPREQVLAYGGSPYGVLWQGRGTLRHKLGTATPVPGVHCAGTHVAGSSGLPWAILTGAVVAEQVGPA